MYVESGCNAQHVNLRRKYIPIGVNKFGMADIFFIEKIKDRKSKFPMWREKFQVFGNAEINSLDWIQPFSVPVGRRILRDYWMY